MAYKIVDLRDKLPGSPVASQGTQKKTTGGIQHFNGDPNGYTGVASGQRTPLQVYTGDANYHIGLDWGGGARANGIQYQRGAWEDTIYLLRDIDSILWHCNKWPENGSSLALNVPISFKERATPRTIQTLREFWDDEMRRQGHTTRKVFGHKEVSSTGCPGSLMEDFVIPYRNSAIGTRLPGEPKAAPIVVPTPTPVTGIRAVDGIRGDARVAKVDVDRYAKSKGATKYALDLIEQIYVYGPKRNIGADFLSVQMLLETGYGHYTGDSRHYNPAGIKTATATGDTPKDFEIPETPAEGARLLVNHWCAVFQLDPIGTPHGRFEIAKKVYASKPPITKISQLGNGNWAMDPDYGKKILGILNNLEGDKPAEPPKKPAPEVPIDPSHPKKPVPAPPKPAPAPVNWKQGNLVPPGFVKKAPRAGDYLTSHPTRYEWRDDVADLIRRIYKKWPNVHINTYVIHPGNEAGVWARDTIAFDVWGPAGRGAWLDLNVGNAICDYVWYDTNPPWIDWYIWQKRIWIRSDGFWKPYGTNEFEWHRDHIHFTFTGSYRLLG